METNEEHYDRLATDYDAQADRNNWIPNEVLEQTLRRLDVRPRRFLDIGAGTGLTAKVLRKVQPMTLVCVEPSDKMRWLGQEQTPQADWVAANGEDYLSSVESESFDVITAIGVLEFIEDPQEFIRACAAALVGGGMLCIAFEVQASTAQGRDERGHYRKALQLDTAESHLTDAGLVSCCRQDFTGYLRGSERVPYVLLAAAKPGL